MNIKIISKNDITPSIWDGGKTYEYVISPADSTYAARDFDFRISSASIEQTPSNFTNFQGYQRYLVMLDNGLKIKRNGIEEAYSKNEIFEFNSADDIQSFSLGTDFNLMVKKEGRPFTVEVKTLNGDLESSLIFVFALHKANLKINQQAYDLNVNDLVLIENEEKLSLRSNQDLIVGWISDNVQ